MPKKYTNCKPIQNYPYPLQFRQKDIIYTKKTLRKGKAYQRVSILLPLIIYKIIKSRHQTILKRLLIIIVAFILG